MRSSSSLPGCRIASTWSPGSSSVEPSAISDLAVAHDRDQPRALGQLEPLDRACRRTATPRVDLHLDDLEVLLAQLEQVDEAVLGHLVLDQRHELEVAQTVGEMPSRSKCSWLRGSLTRAITFWTPYFSRASWQMIDVVLVVAGDARRRCRAAARSRPARARRSRSRRRACTWCSNSCLEPLEAVAALLDQRHLVLRRRAGCARGSRRPSRRRRSGCTSGSRRPRLARCARPRSSARDRRRRRADRAQARAGVERRRAPGSSTRTTTHVDAEPLLRDLADDDVRVVAVGRDDDGVGVLDAGRAQHLGVHAVADDEPAGPVLAEPAERLLLLVDGATRPSPRLAARARSPSRRDRSRSRSPSWRAA